MRSRCMHDVAIDDSKLADISQSSFKELLIFGADGAEHRPSVGWLAIDGWVF